MKRVIIVHGCADNKIDYNYNKHWIPWIKNKLSLNGVEVHVPIIPESWKPSYNKFKNEFEKSKIDKETILVGHSCGCAFLVRWLGETKKEINKLILVAPWKIASRKDKSDKPFYEYEIDKTIKSRIKKIIMFTADDEAYEGRESLKIFKKDLGGEVIELKGHGHYTLDDMGTEEFPELLKEIIK